MLGLPAAALCLLTSLPAETPPLPFVHADRVRSTYSELTANLSIASDAPTVVHSRTITLLQGGPVFLHADGAVMPGQGRAALQIRIGTVDVGNESAIDWSASVSPQPHSFNCVGSAHLDPGTYTVQLVASPGIYTVEIGSNLSVFVAPALNVQGNGYSPPPCIGIAAFNFNTLPMFSPPSTTANYALLPGTPMTGHAFSTSQASYFFGSGTANVFGTFEGDAMFGFFANGAPPPFPQAPILPYSAFRSSLSVDDLYVGAELEGPMFCQAVHDPTVPAIDVAVTLEASEYPLAGDNTVRYCVSSAASVGMSGGLMVHGSASTLPALVFAGVEHSSVGGCGIFSPPLGVPVLVSTANFNVPVGHDGRVFFAGKARCQGDPQDGPGQVFLWLEIDGTRVGSIGHQGLGGWIGGGAHMTSQSQRTLSTSYLTAAQPLAPGTHTVELSTLR